MNIRAASPSISENTSGQQPLTSISFQGFEQPKSNYVFCPNQFFDICLKSKSRGMVRIVAYMIRQTLGWLDENGQPINETVKVSYRDLIEKAGVSRGAIGKALQQAVTCGFLECCVEGQANTKTQAGKTAEYSLRWDTNPQYAKTFADFNGFYAGEGNRTPIPNSFFDIVIPQESLAVTKVVGAVIRHTVGFETRYGGRRMAHPLSCSFIQRYTLLSNRRNLIAAIRHAIVAGFIVKVKAGTFSHRPSEQEATTYGIRWLSDGQNQNSGSKMTPVVQQRFKNDTNNGSKRSPAERFKNDTSIEKTKLNNTLKQQAADLESEVKKRLVVEGFDSRTATKIIEERGVAVVDRQLSWLDARKPENRLAMLRQAIKENWAEPTSFRVKEKIAQARKRDVMLAIAKQAEEGMVAERKQRRHKRKQRLLAEWINTDAAQRAAWIASAFEREPSTTIQKILAKQNSATAKPHFQVLDEIAFDWGLETVCENRQSNDCPSVAEQPQQVDIGSNSDPKMPIPATPQKKKCRQI